MNSYKIFTSPVSTLNGYSDGMSFTTKNIYNIGDLYNIFTKLNYSITDFEYYIEISLNIYSNFYRKNIVKQIEYIYKSHKDSK
jgi:hypothetical protein